MDAVFEDRAELLGSQLRETNILFLKRPWLLQYVDKIMLVDGLWRDLSVLTFFPDKTEYQIFFFDSLVCALPDQPANRRRIHHCV